MSMIIDNDLLKFEDTVVPELGNMNSAAQDYIKRNNNVAETASACAGALGGSYKSNNVGKAIKTFNDLSTGCKNISGSLSSKLLPILAECAELAALIEELHQLLEKFLEIAQRKSAKLAADPNADTSQEDAEMAATEAKFHAKHAQAKAKLAALKGKDATVPNMNPTNGSLSYQPNIQVNAEKGSAGLKGDYYNYQMGDQSITSIQK